MSRALSSSLSAAFAVVATLVLVVAPAIAEAAELTFVQQELGAGTVIDQKTVMSFDMSMKMTMPDGNGMNMDMKMNDVEDKQVKILEADGQGPKSISVMYRTRGTEQTLFGQTQNQPMGVAGQTFTLQRGGAVEPTPPAGPAAEEVAGELDQLDSLRSFVKSLETSTIPIGESVDLAALQKSGLLGATPTDGAQLEKGVLTLTEQRVIEGKPYGVFVIDMRMTGQDPATGMKMAMDMKGELLIDTTTGWMRSMDFSGPVTMSGTTVENGMEMKMDATGSFTMKTDAAYSR